MGSGSESLAFGRARSAAGIFGFIHPVVRAGRSEPELCAIDPHAVQDDSDLASDGYDGTPTALGLHQPHAPGLQARPFDRAHEHGVGGGVPAFADLRALVGAILALEPDTTPFRYASPLQGVMFASRPSKEGR